MAIKISRRAQADIDAIYLESFRRFGEQQADRYVSDLLKVFDLLADQPAIAREREELTPVVRVYPFKAHVILYRSDGAELKIVRLRHGREDWQGDPAADDETAL